MLERTKALTPGAGTDTNSGTDSSTNTGASTTTTPEETTGTNSGGETATDVVEDEKKEDTRYDLVYKLIRSDSSVTDVLKWDVALNLCNRETTVELTAVDLPGQPIIKPETPDVCC